MHRSSSLSDIIGAVAGVLFAVLLFISTSSVDPQRGVTDQELLNWWSESGNRDAFVLSMYTLLLTGPLFLIFLSRLQVRLRAADTEGGWAGVVYAAGIACAVGLAICAIARGVIASSMRFGDEPLPGVDTLRYATSLAYMAWDPALLFAMVLIATVSALILVTRILPRWIGWLGVVTAAGGAVLFVLQVAAFAIPLFIIWVLANSFQIFRTRGAAFTSNDNVGAGVPGEPAPSLAPQR